MNQTEEYALKRLHGASMMGQKSFTGECLRLLSAAEPNSEQYGHALSAVVSICAVVISEARAGGYSFGDGKGKALSGLSDVAFLSLPFKDMVCEVNISNQAERSRKIGLLISYAGGLIGMGVKFRIQYPMAQAKRAEPAQQINITLKQEGPLPVEIVSMPDRLTTTALSYDASGNIKTSTQLEKDA